jgi:DNA-binding response OmpR family regulator
MQDFQPRKILIVDNDEDVLVSLERVLEDEHYATVTAVSHQQAASLLCQDTFDLLVLDDHLSDTNAVEVLTQLRKCGVRPLVVVTYHHDMSRHQRARLHSLGAAALVNKRAHAALVEIVDYLLERHNQEWAEFDSIT